MILVALDIDGTLIDTRPSFTRIVKELSGASDDEIWRFRDTGGFNDDWDLIRACIAWIKAGRPEIFDGLQDVEDVVRRVGCDPGDMSAQGSALYRSGYWRNERVLVDGKLLHAAASKVRLAACTGRDLWELERAQEMLGFVFEHRTTMEDVKKPDPRALLRLVEGEQAVFLVGDTAADRQCAERAGAHFYQVTGTRVAREFLQLVADGVGIEGLVETCRS